MKPGTNHVFVVSGGITGEATFGVTILLEIVPRPGNTGTLRFTPAPPVDISQLGDPWPGEGTFSPFDTDLSKSHFLNGSVDDNGVFLPEPVTFSGPLAAFPVEADADARGTWDIRLDTAAGASSWEGLATALVPGTVCVASSSPGVDLWFQPAEVSVTAGNAFQISLVASSRTCSDVPVSSIEVLLTWDSSAIVLRGNKDDGPADWAVSGFPDDSSLDGLNAPFSGLPANDGDAYYLALAATSDGESIPPEGIVVTTFEWEALNQQPLSPIVISPSVGAFSETRVLGAGPLVGMDLTGTLGSADVSTTLVAPTVGAFGLISMMIVVLSLGSGIALRRTAELRQHSRP